MGSIYYVGLNAYQQCPQEKQTLLPKILTDWQKYSLETACEVMCSFMKVVLKMDDSFIIFGLNTGDNSDNSCRTIRFDRPVKTFLVTEDFLVISRENKLWKSNYTDNWSQIVYSFSKGQEELIWDNKVVLKLSFLHGSQIIVLLLNDGSVWQMDSDNKLSIIYDPSLDKAVDISCGFEHGLILTESGCVLSFGNGSHGQLGHGDLLPSSESLQVLGLGGLRVIKIAAGGWHSCAITDSGDLYSWGWNNFGQLTEIRDESYSEDGYGVVALPMLIDIDKDTEKIVADVACGTRHTVVLTDQNELFSTGWNEYGQLGLNDPSIIKINKFKKTVLQLDRGKKILHCGPWSTILYEAETVHVL